MTVLYLCLAFVLITGTIPAQFAHDTSRDRAARDIARLSAELPPARESLAWPEPLSPLDLPSLGDTEALAATVLSSRVFVPAPEPFVVGLAVGGGRHHIGVAPGTEAQRAHWNTPTGKFWLIVDGLADLSLPCAHCAAPEDGEPAHAGCPGCACPCSLEVAAA